jgi:flagellar basal-body rod protein FlgG
MIQSLASNMQAQWQRHELLANNLANASTAGFKQDDLMLLQGGVPPWEAGASASGPAPAGAQTVAPWTDFSQAPIRQTDRKLDVALDGSGFLVVQTPQGPRYTRSGALAMSRDGYLVTASGDQVLGDNGPIAIRSSGAVITPRGEVQEEGRTVATIRVVDFPKPYRLLKEGDGLFVPADPTAAPVPAQDYQVLAGALEDSNVNTVRTMVGMIAMLRNYESAQRAIQAADEADRYAANDMGRV